MELTATELTETSFTGSFVTWSIWCWCLIYIMKDQSGARNQYQVWNFEHLWPRKPTEKYDGDRGLTCWKLVRKRALVCHLRHKLKNRHLLKHWTLDGNTLCQLSSAYRSCGPQHRVGDYCGRRSSPSLLSGAIASFIVREAMRRFIE